MKTEIIQLSNHLFVTYYIGQHSQDNFTIIDQAEDNDIWFHVHHLPSCHVIASMKNVCIANKKELHKIITAGAVLCKQHSTYFNHKQLEIMFTRIKNVIKTVIEGTVETSNIKSIKI